MKNLLTVLVILAGWLSYAQTKVTESAQVNGQTMLELGFDFADDIEINTWNKNEVLVEVSVSINDGEYDHIFTLEKRVTDRTIEINMDKDMWDKLTEKTTTAISDQN